MRTKYKLLILLVSVLLCGCNSQERQLKKLLAERGIECESISKPDSIMEFSDVWAMHVVAWNQAMKGDSLYHIADKMPDGPDKDAVIEEAGSYCETAERAEKIAFSDMKDRLAWGLKPEFIGYQFVISKTNLLEDVPYYVRVTKDMKHIAAIWRTDITWYDDPKK